jgi:predicted hydrocarbon binding protein
MNRSDRAADLALPAASLTALGRALAAEIGAERAAHALRAAGHAAGDALFRGFARGATGEAADEAAATALAGLPEERFWQRFAEFFAGRGWGRLTFEAVHPGVGALASGDCVEAVPGADAPIPGCHFTTGVLANLLGRVAGDDVAVLEVECRSSGDPRCRFLFGAPAALDAVFADLAAGRDVDASLAALR